MANDRKRCSLCHVRKSVDEFYTCVQSRTGKIYRQSRCKDCQTKNRISGDVRRDQWLRLTYNITLAEYNQLLEQQGGVCAICGIEPQLSKPLHVDHDHSCCPDMPTGAKKTCGLCIRGLLCGDCNRGIGLFDNDPTLLIEAAEYVKRGVV